VLLRERKVRRAVDDWNKGCCLDASSPRESIAMRKAILLGAFLVLIQIPLVGLVLLEERTWGGPNEDEAADVAVAPDGSVYVTGTTLSFGAGGRDAFVLKYAPDGSLSWQRTYGTTPSPITAGHEFGLSVAAAADGSAYVTGQFGQGNLFLLKFDPAGNLLWQRTWGNNGDVSRGVAIAADRSVYVAGVTFTSGQGQGDALLVRFTPDGDVVWARTWGGPFRDVAHGLAVGADGGIYIAGETSSFFANDAFLVKFAPDGAVLWERDWGTVGPFGAGFTLGLAVGTSPDGSVYMTGNAGGTGADESVVLVKFDAGGALLWEKLSAPRFGSGNDVAVAADGTVYVSGTAPDSSGGSDAFVIRFLSNGRPKDASTWGGAGQESGESIAVAPDGSLVVVGIASAPPYALNRAAHRTVKPASVLHVPAGVVTVPSGAIGFPVGIVTIPNGSETFAGLSDAARLRLVP
jgi:uncharacterized delta-60 repeat protein